jgi:hypothetical protein
MTPQCREWRIGPVLTKFVNALRPSALDTEGTGTYPDGLFAAALMRQAPVEAGGSLRSSYGQDYLAAQKLKEPPRTHS